MGRSALPATWSPQPCNMKLCILLATLVASSMAAVTTSNQQCVFPFVYKGVTYNGCTSADWSQPWCATATDNGNYNGQWGNCETAGNIPTGNDYIYHDSGLDVS